MTGLRDVAALAGVSPATVSRVVNRPELVNAVTRKRVEEAIAKIGYRPSRVARRLRVERGRSGIVALLIPDIQNPFFADLARGVEDAAQREGYTVLLGNVDEDAEKERRYLEVMTAESVDGIILPPTSGKDPAAAELVRKGLPVVCVDRRLARVKVDTVLVDNVRGAFDAAEHLIRLGHRRIGFLEGRREISSSQERLQGYERALSDHGLRLDRSLLRAGDSRQASGARFAAELLDSPLRPTALLVGNNLMTLGALETIHRLRLRIPEDIALVGYDDMPWALALDPPLTAVRQPAYEMGSRAMELLLHRIRDPKRSTTLLTLDPELIVRRSCGAGAPAPSPRPPGE